MLEHLHDLCSLGSVLAEGGEVITLLIVDRVGWRSFVHILTTHIAYMSRWFHAYLGELLSCCRRL